jgi:hypothetical protein
MMERIVGFMVLLGGKPPIGMQKVTKGMKELKVTIIITLTQISFRL